MKVRLLFLLRLYIIYIGVFVFMKPIFMLYNHSEYTATGKDYLDVMAHGLPLDLSTAGYLMAFPLALTLLSVWVKIPFRN